MNQWEAILKFINEAYEPTDVERVRIACKIGNWNTALKHCLVLLIEGKIEGQKTSKGWVFWSCRSNLLKTCQSATGRLGKIDIRPLKTFVKSKEFLFKNRAFCETLLAEKDFMNAEEFLAKLETWINLSKVS